VENRPGAGTIIGTAAAAKSPADGYTLLLSSIATHAFSPHLYSKPGYDPVNLPDIKDKLKDLGSDGVGNSPEAFGQFVLVEHAKYGKLIKEMGVKPE